MDIKELKSEIRLLDASMFFDSSGEKLEITNLPIVTPNLEDFLSNRIFSRLDIEFANNRSFDINLPNLKCVSLSITIQGGVVNLKFPESEIVDLYITVNKAEKADIWIPKVANRLQITNWYSSTNPRIYGLNNFFGEYLNISHIDVQNPINFSDKLTYIEIKKCSIPLQQA